MQRYRVIEEVLAEEKPKTILEVGTWNGNRAVRMVKAANAEFYFGFDLFEFGTKEIDEKEFNAKPRQNIYRVHEVLDSNNIRHELYRGDSKETLPQFLHKFGDNSVDFAYIDGGHSVETIESDWNYVSRAVKPNGLVIFDDYYTDGPDIEKVGCNKTVEKLKHEVVPIADPVKGGGYVYLVMVRNVK